MHVPSLALQTPLSRVTSVCLMPTSAWPAGIWHRWAHGWLACARLPSLTQPVPCWAFELSQRNTTEMSISVMLSWFNRKILLAYFWFCIDLSWESCPPHEGILNFIFEHFFFSRVCFHCNTNRKLVSKCNTITTRRYARIFLDVASTLLSLLESIQLSLVAASI